MRFDRDLIVTIDGPSGVGKTTVSRSLADALGYFVLDSGSLYRAVTWAALKEGTDLTNEAAVGFLAQGLSLKLRPAGGVLVGGVDVSIEIRQSDVTSSVSRVSAHPRVRDALVGLQRSMARDKRLVAEGRDMGTVIFPDAEYKFFLDASVEERARRRHRELTASPRGDLSSYDVVLQQVRDRDDRDSTRETAPLKAADDAVRIVTDQLTTDEVVAKLIAEIQSG